MKRDLVTHTVAAAAALVLATLPAWAVKGQVVDGGGKPMEGVRACRYQVGVETVCMPTNSGGNFEMPDNPNGVVRLLAKEYVPQEVPAIGDQGRIMLLRTPTMWVQLVDSATGEGIGKGEVFVMVADGSRKGPFPTNPAGVRIQRVLEPGEIKVFGEAKGYVDTQAKPATLVAGEELKLVVLMTPAPAPPPEAPPAPAPPAETAPAEKPPAEAGSGK